MESMVNNSANAVWTGALKSGEGRISTGHALLKDAPFSFRSRFEDGNGTNPEELIAAAHCGCFSMALSAALEKAGFTPVDVKTDAVVSLEFVDGAPTLTKSKLTTVVNCPGIDNDQFQVVAADAKKNCPISRVLNLDIELDATLA